MVDREKVLNGLHKALARVGAEIAVALLRKKVSNVSIQRWRNVVQEADRELKRLDG